METHNNQTIYDEWFEFVLSFFETVASIGLFDLVLRSLTLYLQDWRAADCSWQILAQAYCKEGKGSQTYPYWKCNCSMNPLVRRVCWRLVGRSVIISCRSTSCVKKSFFIDLMLFSYYLQTVSNRLLKQMPLIDQKCVFFS